MQSCKLAEASAKMDNFGKIMIHFGIIGLSSFIALEILLVSKQKLLICQMTLKIMIYAIFRSL